MSDARIDPRRDSHRNAHSERPSLWRRTRYWTTAACAAAALSGLLCLALGHPIHGLLLLLAAFMLSKGSVLGRRGRRSGTAHAPALATASGHGPRSKFRKAA
jgi:hypothetical protein